MSRHPLVARVLAPDAPLALRLAAARGALPVPRSVILPALVSLTRAEQPEVSRAAKETLEGIGDRELIECLSGGEVESEVVDHLILNRKLSGELLSTVLNHPAASKEALLGAAGSDGGEVIDFLVSNQERLIGSPELVARLEANASLNSDQRRRLEDFKEHFASIAAPETAEAGPRTATPDIVGEAELKALLEEVGDLPFLSVDLGDLVDSERLVLIDGEDIAGDADLESAWQRLLNLAGPLRLREALRGGREERSILIRDRNRIIAAAVLKNPRVTENEIRSFAALRSVNEDILRMIGLRREWMRNYSIVRQLVANPKTPPGVAMNNLSRLITRDLKVLMRDHNVPDLIRRSAKRQIDVREKRPTLIRGKR